ncbi:MAG: T9SS type A sorting domain-containing protein [Bacteroidales bacterium]
MKNNTRNIFGRLSTWIMVILFIAPAPFANAQSLTLDDPTSGATYEIEEEFNITYSATGTWPSTVKFAAVVKATVDTDGTVRHKILKESTIVGISELIENAKMISNPWWFEDLTNPTSSHFISNYELGIVAYKGNELVLNNKVYGPLEDEDFLVIQGQENEHAVDYWIDQEGNRKLVTKAFDLAGPNKSFLSFNYYADNILISESTLPQLLVSIDGGVTFTPLAVADGDFKEKGFLADNAWSKPYIVEIPQDYATSATHFMWRQQANGGKYKDRWMIEDVVVLAGNSTVHEGFQDFIDINLTWPTLSNYTWTLKKEEGLEPTLFNGSIFTYTWALIPAQDPLPAGTKVEFFLWDFSEGDFAIDPSTGNTISFGSVNSADDYEATIPFLTRRDEYGIRAIATLNGEVYNEGLVNVINVFNDALRITPVDPNPVVFAGQQVEFTAALENTIDISNYDNTWFYLVMDDGSNTWVLDEKQGLNENFVANLHPSISGNVEYMVNATFEQVLVEIGEPLTNFGNMSLYEADMDGVYYDYWGGFELDSWGEIQQIYTNGNDNNLDLTNFSAIEFKVRFENKLEDLTDDQKLVLGYSVDGGVTFTDIATYPDARFTNPIFFDGEDLDSWFNEYILLPEEAQTEETILRWRVEESNGLVEIRNIELIWALNPIGVPIRPIVYEQNISPQRIDLTANNLTVCPNSTIDFTYNIRGRFGEKNVAWIDYTDDDGGTYYDCEIGGKKLVFPGITEGTGTVSLPLGQLDELISGSNIKFNLNIEDFEFDEETTFSIYSDDASTLGVEIIAPIESAKPVVSAQSYGDEEHYSCTDEERIVVISNIREYFTYQLRNVITGDLIGEPVFVDSKDKNLLNSNTYPVWYPTAGDDAEGILEINIGTITERTLVEVIVTSHNNDNSLTCQTYLANDQAVFNTRDITIQYSWASSEIGPGYWKDVTGNEDFTVCEGSNDLSLRLYDNTKEGPVTGEINWYRNNTKAPINYFAATGEYYAIYKHGNCTDYTSDMVQITVVEKPTKPVITFEGSQEICEGDFATLTTSDEYEYYKWYKNGTTVEGANSNTLEIYENGTYWVEVSNQAFDLNVGVCSEISDPFTANFTIHKRPNSPNFNLIDGVLCEPGAAQVNLGILENDVRYQLYNWQTKKPTGKAVLAGNQSSVILTSDVLTKNTKLGVIATRNNEQMCGSVYSTSFKEVSVHDLYIDVNGNTLIASIKEADASTYQWYRNDKIINYGGDSRTLNIYDDAKYKVVVETYDGCTIESSIGNGPAEKEPEKVTATTLSLFPNPASDIITINFANADDETVRIRILNISGEVVFDKEVVKADSELRYAIPISKFNNGAYIVHVIGKQEVKVQQFIKF